MKGFIICIVCILQVILLYGQEKWTILSQDERLKAINYLNEDQCPDSVIVKTANHCFKFFRDDTLYNQQNQLILNSFYTKRLVKLSEDTYVILGNSCRNFGASMNLIIVRGNEILKHFFIETRDRDFPSIRVFYDTINGEFIIRNLVTKELEFQSVCELSPGKRMLMGLIPEKMYDEKKLLKTVLVFKPIPDWDGGEFEELEKLYYKIKL